MSGSYTQTPNLGLYKPTPNSDTGTWGIHLNANADTLDALLGTTGGDGGPVTATGAITARTLPDHFADVVYARDFGAIFDGNSHPLSASFATLAAAQAVYPKATALTNEMDGIAVQAAIDFCAARAGSTHEYSFGGTVVLPNALGLMNTPLTINNSCVSLVADNVWHIGFRSNMGFAISAPTKLRWTGPALSAPAATVYMLTIRPSDGGKAIEAANVHGILFDCNQVAGVAGVLLKSVRQSSLAFAAQEPRGVLYTGATLASGSKTIAVSSTANIAVGQSIWSPSLPIGGYVAAVVDGTHITASVQATANSTETVCIGGEGVRMDVEDNITDVNDTQGNDCWLTVSNEQAAAYASGPCLMLGGSCVHGSGSTGPFHFGNTSLNLFHTLRLISAHNPMLVVNYTDHNLFDMVDCFNSGGAAPTGLVLNGTSDANNGPAAFNKFHYVGGAIQASGTDVAGFTQASIFNQVTFLDTANGGAIGHVGTSATLAVSTHNPTTLLVPYQSNQGIAPYPPDNTVIGGNGRGSYSVDLQTNRVDPTQVASGAMSVLAGGQSNVASATYAAVSGGAANQATAIGACIPGGEFNLATGQFAIATGNSALADLYALRAHTGNQLVGGKRQQQQIQVLLGVSAANTTPVRLTADGATAGAANVMNATYGTETITLSVQLAASDGNNFYSWAQPMGMLRRNGGVGAMVYTPGTPTSAANGTTTGIAITEAADTTNGGYSLTFTPPTGNTAIWKVCATVTATRCDG